MVSVVVDAAILALFFTRPPPSTSTSTSTSKGRRETSGFSKIKKAPRFLVVLTAITPRLYCIRRMYRMVSSAEVCCVGWRTETRDVQGTGGLAGACSREHADNIFERGGGCEVVSLSGGWRWAGVCVNTSWVVTQ